MPVPGDDLFIIRHIIKNINYIDVFIRSMLSSELFSGNLVFVIIIFIITIAVDDGGDNRVVVEDACETLDVMDSFNSFIRVDHGSNVVLVNKATGDDLLLLKLATDGEDLPIFGGLEPVEKDLAGLHLLDVRGIGDPVHYTVSVGRTEP